MNVSAILLAAGSGRRLGSRIPKSLIYINGRMLVEHSLAKLSNISDIRQIIVTLPDKFVDKISKLLSRYEKAIFVKGGKERYDSVRIAFKAVDAGSDYVLIHDAARPMIGIGTIKKAISVARQRGNCVVGYKLKDTIKRISKDRLTENLRRDDIFVVETPQVFKVKEFKKYVSSKTSSRDITDDAHLMIENGVKVNFIEADEINMKLTTKSDLLAISKLND